MKCLAVDYDGTLKRQGKVNPDTIEALKNFRKEGNIFGIVTGRSVQSIILELAHYGIDIDFLVANNGGVLAKANGEILSVDTIDLVTVKELIQLVKGYDDCASYVLNDGRYRSRHILNDQLIDMKYGQMDSMVDEKEMLERGKIAQMVISLANNDHRHEYAKMINERFEGKVVAYPNERCLDVVPYGVSKASGLAKAIESYQFEKVISVGDNFNDIPMLKAYHGVSFHDSFDEVKQAAEFCIDEILDLFTKYSI